MYHLFWVFLQKPNYLNINKFYLKHQNVKIHVYHHFSSIHVFLKILLIPFLSLDNNIYLYDKLAKNIVDFFPNLAFLYDFFSINLPKINTTIDEHVIN